MQMQFVKQMVLIQIYFFLIELLNVPVGIPLILLFSSLSHSWAGTIYTNSTTLPLPSPMPYNSAHCPAAEHGPVLSALTYPRSKKLFLTTGKYNTENPKRTY